MSVSVLLFLCLMFGLVYLMRRARIGALVAFLFAGILSGPYVFNLFAVSDVWSILGEIGILFLWFTIGLEINMRRLWRMRRTIFGFGAAQVMMVAVMMFPLLFNMTSWTITGCVMVAMLLAMSSTSADMQLLIDRNQLNTDIGTQAFSVLLFQDLFSIPLLAMLPALSGKAFSLGATIIDVAVISVALVVLVVLVGRFVLNPIFRLVARVKSKEAFLLAVLLNIVLWCVLLELLGLPAGLGAFLAGMLMSETVFRHQITAQVEPYSMLFLAFFFIALGIGLNLPILMDNWYIVFGGLLALVTLKFFAIFMVARVRGVAVPSATMIALILAQGGEFGLLMLQTIKTSGITVLPLSDIEILTAIIVLSIMTTPLLLCLHDYLQRRGLLYPLLKNHNHSDKNEARPDVYVCGFGRVGQTVCQMLDARGISYVAIDVDISSVMMGRERGFNVVYGDTTNADILREFGFAPRKSRAVVVALDNATTARRTILAIKSIAPRAHVFARARNLADAKILLAEGIETALPETIESSFFLGYTVLNHLGVSDRQIDELLAEMRADNYSALDVQISDKQE